MEFDPRDRDGDTRDVDMPWVDVRHGPDVEGTDWRDHDRDARDRDPDLRERGPRDPFVDGLDLPRGTERSARSSSMGTAGTS